MDGAAYQAGRRVPGTLTLDEAWRWHERDDLGEDAFVWLGLHMPSVAEVTTAQKMFDLHELAVEDALGDHVRPKLEIYDETLFIVLRTARCEAWPADLRLGEISVFVGVDFVVSVRHGQASPLSGVREEAERRPDLLALGPSAVLHAIADRVVGDYEPVLDALEQRERELEREVFADSRDQPTRDIYQLIRHVLDLLTAIEPLSSPLERLATSCDRWVSPEIAPFFRDVSDALVRSVERARNLYNLLVSVLGANQTQVGIRQNEDMRKISAWVAIAAVPTLIAGVYGMNFDHMPELRSGWGYPLVLLGMACLCYYLYRRFKASGWL